MLALLASFGACLLIDYQLYQRQWFLNHFFQGTQESQIVRKLQRAPRLASVADVIAFGSSFIRSSISSEPYLERGLLPFNYAVSGGGPIYSYYALSQIAPELERRTMKPLIVMELSLNLVDRSWAIEPGGSWSEYQHLFAVARSRFMVARHFVLLWSNFHENSQSSQFLSTAFFPSNGYRVYNRSIGSLTGKGLSDFLLKEKGKNEYFYGIEDIGGFDPSYAVTPANPPKVDWVPLPIERFVPAKVAFLKMFIELASQLGVRVVVLPSPSIQRGYYMAFQNLSSDLERAYPQVRVIRHPDYGLHRTDFDPTGHMNIWGADHLTDWLISYLHLSGDKQRLQQKIRFAFETVTGPPFSKWEFSGAETAVDQRDPYQVIWSTKSAQPSLATSPWISVTRDRQYVLEFSASTAPGRFFVQMATDGSQGEATSTETTPNLREHPEPTRYFLRLTPNGSRLKIRIRYQPSGSEKDGDVACIRLIRLFGHL